ncbi:hypothetical protein Cgig2_026624 [Carnegiea gigantea]|uniref:CCDC22 coiled-coil domain-containing protein n=1 Tax=Carnegiea gigantea TaxID=171969 RepID=A0A9Q1JX90_9CARY|nr:hypothetical protein Cgig2_026624 [Carnegiea gigantea]
MARMQDLSSESHPCELSTNNFEPPLPKRDIAFEDLDEAAYTSISVQCTTEEQTGRGDDQQLAATVKHILKPEQESASCKEFFPELTCNREEGYNLEKVSEEFSVEDLGLQPQVEELELLKKAVQMALDNEHSVSYYIEQLNEQIEVRRQNLQELENQWEEECTKLTRELEKQPKVESRRSYIERITEITKNSRKLDADIERILKETRELQLESNSVEERLHRTYAVVDETVFREAKKDSVGRQSYRLLTSIHECFEEIREKILATDKAQREVAELQAKLSVITSQDLGMDKLQADLDAMRMENEHLDNSLQNH